MRVLLITYDNESFIQWFPQGIAYLTAVLLKHGHYVDIYEQDIHHYPEEHLTETLNNEYYDVVGFGIVGGYYEYNKAKKIAAAINKSKQRPFFVIGGHGPSPIPEFMINKLQCDAVVIGEGEETIIDLLDALEKKRPLSKVLGIAYRDSDGSVKINPRRPLIKDIDNIPMPAYDKFNIIHYRKFMSIPHRDRTDFVMPVLSGRGCKFRCNFCYRMDKGFRARSNESIIEEIKFLKEKYRINYIIFSDELLMSSKERTISLCEAIIKSNLKIKWCCNGRLNYATPEVLKLMKRAGCVFINYGIECFDDQVLRNMNKALTTKQIIKGVEATLEAGISPGLNIIFGNIGDNRETLRKSVEFLLKYDDGAQLRTIRPVTPYPGSPLYYYAIEKGLLRDAEDFYEHKHKNSDLLTVNFTTLSDEEYYEALYEANLILLNNYYDRMRKNIEILDNLYKKRDATFRGFRQM